MEEKAAPGEQAQATWKDGPGREARWRLGRTKRDGQLRFEELKFDNLALHALPIDSIQDNYPRQVPNANFSRVRPTPVAMPRVVAYSETALTLLDLKADQPDFAEYYSGNKIIPGSEPAAHCYCGHQFGYFSGQLGDGATMYLGEIINMEGERWEMQFKGAGKTPYSRTADGRKVLRSSLREFLCSEAMYFLGIPTTRSPSIVTSDTYVVRDIKYDGNPIKESATIIVRLAPTFLRFGSFEIFKMTDETTGRAGPSAGNKELLKKLTEYTIETFFPEIWKASEDPIARYLGFYREVVLSTAALVAEWQCVGWCHGVLNTDNMSIVGVTIDYGPFGFMEHFDPGFICNGSDNAGRYSYEAQPPICKWNCEKLGEALTPLLPRFKWQTEFDKFMPEYERCYLEKMRKKLGLLRKDLPEDKELIASLLEVMKQTGADWTNTFRHLSTIKIPLTERTKANQEKETANESEKEKEKGNKDEDEALRYLLIQGVSVEALKAKLVPSIPVDKLRKLIALAQSDPRLLMLAGITDPSILVGEIEKYNKLADLEGTTEESKREKDTKLWTEWMQRYRERLKREVEDIRESEEAVSKACALRVGVMNRNNPKYVLRNYIAQRAIEKAEKGDYSEARKVLKMLETPYEEQGDEEYTGEDYAAPPPKWAHALCVT